MANRIGGVATAARAYLDSVISQVQAAAAQLAAVAVRYDGAQVLSGVQQGVARSNIGAQAALGFNPVQQGGGNGQGSNAVKLGWSGVALKAQVDASDLGSLWTDSLGAASLAQFGYQKLPSGLIIQWGMPGGSSTWTFPVAFPNAAFACVCTTFGGWGNNVGIITEVAALDKNTATFGANYFGNNYAGSAGNQPVCAIVVGY